MGSLVSFGIYVHYPYCIHHCPYCDFNVAVVKAPPHERYRCAVEAELALRTAVLGPRPPAVSLYFGGGTPGIWPVENMASIIRSVGRTVGLESDAEITVECNPETTNLAFFVSLLEAGANRLSLGAQSFDDQTLEFLGRAHRCHDIERAVRDARTAGFQSISLDLIHGARGQSPEAALDDVVRAADLGVDHISTYQLTIEPQTPFGSRARRGEVLLGNEENLVEMFDALRERLRTQGFEPYEISSAARPGHESKHNRLYWTGGEFLGLGAGAHGRFMAPNEVVRYANERSHVRYMGRLEAGRLPDCERMTMNADDWLEEKVITGLRMDEGIAIDADMERRFGGGAQRLAERGLLTVSDGRWAASDAGRRLLDTVIVELIS